MKPENKKILDDNRTVYDKLKSSSAIRSLDYHTRQEFARIIAEEFQPGYQNPGDCPPCVIEMIYKVYRHYDEWRTNNKII
jgi:hypothetical protein